MNAQELWSHYRRENEAAPERYAAFAFGNTKALADELADLVNEGVKTATCSNFAAYELEGTPLPKKGEFAIVLDGNEASICVIQLQKVSVMAFNEVTKEHAWKEGEGDRTYAYWRKAHIDFFKAASEKIPALQFDEEMPVLCEEFVVVYRP